jgi:hypothetical protein
MASLEQRNGIYRVVPGTCAPGHRTSPRIRVAGSHTGCLELNAGPDARNFGRIGRNEVWADSRSVYEVVSTERKHDFSPPADEVPCG